MLHETWARGAPLAGFGYDGAAGGTGDGSPDAATFGDTDGGVALFGKRGGFGFFVGEITLGGGELGLSGLADSVPGVVSLRRMPFESSAKVRSVAFTVVGRFKTLPGASKESLG